MVRLTEAEVLEALLDAQKQRAVPIPAVTTREYAKARNISILVAREELRSMQAEGKAEVVRIRSVRLDGLETVVPAWRLKEVQ